MSDFNDVAAQPIIDGHIVHFLWERDSVRIFRVDCPNDDATGICNRRRSYCVVDRFISVYGYELNMGTTPLDGPIEVAWVPVYGESDLDQEFASVWLMPVKDPEFKATYLPSEDDD